MSRPVPWKYLLKVQLPILLAIMIAIGVFGKQKASAIAFTALTSTVLFFAVMLVMVKLGYDPSKQRERQMAMAAERRRIAAERRAAKVGGDTKGKGKPSASVKPKVAPTSRTNAGNKRPGPGR
jgi:phosphotransferase system  glucose/maltose/N-acetylglucosamine-specific IIC component